MGCQMLALIVYADVQLADVVCSLLFLARLMPVYLHISPVWKRFRSRHRFSGRRYPVGKGS